MTHIPDTHLFSMLSKRNDDELLAPFKEELSTIITPILPAMDEVTHYFEPKIIAKGIANGIEISTNHFKCSGSEHESVNIFLVDKNIASNQRTTVIFGKKGDAIDFTLVEGTKKDIMELLEKTKDIFAVPQMLKGTIKPTEDILCCMCG